MTTYCVRCTCDSDRHLLNQITSQQQPIQNACIRTKQMFDLVSWAPTHTHTQSWYWGSEFQWIVFLIENPAEKGTNVSKQTTQCNIYRHIRSTAINRTRKRLHVRSPSVERDSQTQTERKKWRKKEQSLTACKHNTHISNEIHFFPVNFVCRVLVECFNSVLYYFVVSSLATAQVFHFHMHSCAWWWLHIIHMYVGCWCIAFVEHFFSGELVGSQNREHSHISIHMCCLCVYCGIFVISSTSCSVRTPIPCSMGELIARWYKYVIETYRRDNTHMILTIKIYFIVCSTTLYLCRSTTLHLSTHNYTPQKQIVDGHKFVTTTSWIIKILFVPAVNWKFCGEYFPEISC